MLSLIFSSVLQINSLSSVSPLLLQDNYGEAHRQLNIHSNQRLLAQAEANALEQLIQQGEIASEAREWSKAETIWQQVITVQPNNANAYSKLCRALSLQDKDKLNKDKLNQAKKTCNKAVALNPKLADAYISRGTMYAILKVYDQAIADFNQAIALNPQLGRAYNNRGLTYRDLKRYEEAISDFDRAITLDPKEVLPYYNRGRTYRDLKRYEEAIVDFNQAIALDPKKGFLYNNRGLTYRDLKRYEEAIVDFNQAIALDPKKGFLYNNRGLTYRYLKRYEEAISDLDRAILIDPKNADAYNDRGICYYDLKQYDKAISDYDQSIMLNASYFGSYGNRANAYMALIQYKKALTDYKIASKLNPNTHSHTNIGIIYYEQGNYKAALQQFQKSLKLKDTAEATLLQAIALHKLGQSTMVRELVEKALLLDPTFAKEEVQRYNLWGDNLVVDAKALLTALNLL
jgi:tetratricopeptide (TPR) repeat protein